MAKSKQAAPPIQPQSNAVANMTHTLADASAQTAVLERPPGAGPLKEGSPPPPTPSMAPRKQNGQFSKAQETARQERIAEANRLRSEANARADAALDKLFAAEDKPAETEQAKDDAPAASEDAPEAKTTTDEKKGRDPATEEALDKALKALRLDNWTTEDLKNHDEAAIIRLGTKASERQAEVSNKIREASEKAKAAEQSPQTSQEPASQPAFDVAGAIKETVQVLGEDTAPALSKLVESVTKQAAARSSALETQNQQLGIRLVKLEVGVARSELAATWPELAQEGRFETVMTKAAALWKSGDYQSISDAMHDACVLKLGQPLKERQDADEIRKKREAGQPRQEQSKNPPRARTIGEFQDDVLDKLFAGDKDGARRVKRG